MNEIKYLGEIGGSNNPMIMTLPISTESDIKKGTPIFYNKLTVSTLESDGSTLIGILAEDYYCKKNELIPGSGNGEIKIITSKNAVYESTGVIFGTAGTSDNYLFWILENEPDQNALDCLSNSKFVLYKKMGAMNPDNIGTVYATGECIWDGTFVGFKCESIQTSSDDQFIFLPPYGYEYIHLKDNGQLILDYTKKGNIKIIGCNEKHGTIKFMLTDII